MTYLYVAAGGGGDALAAAIVHRAMGRRSRPVVATYAWDRLAVDPLPGPRTTRDFAGLQPVGQHNLMITAGTRPKPPAGSTLPRLAAELHADLVLLDPSSGAQGMRTQLAELAVHYGAGDVTVIDVGGDAVARGDEDGLRSPLADGLALSACTDIAEKVTVLVAGPGLDGELPEADVLRVTGNTPLFTLGPADVEAFRAVLDWHPSEATALLAAGARGLRGRVEVRDAGLPVTLTGHSPSVFALPLEQVLAINRLAPALATTTTLAEAESIARRVCGLSEIDYERRKAQALSDRRQAEPASVDDTVRELEEAMRARGVDYATFRRIAEGISLGSGAAAGLRAHLVATRPHRYAWPIWSIHDNGRVTARPEQGQGRE